MCKTETLILKLVGSVSHTSLQGELKVWSSGGAEGGGVIVYNDHKHSSVFTHFRWQALAGE